MHTFWKTTDELYHYGRLGMRWGKHIFGRYSENDIRKYQKPDGSLTRAGRKKQASRDADVERLTRARKNEEDKLEYYKSMKTASDSDVYENAKRVIKYATDNKIESIESMELKKLMHDNSKQSISNIRSKYEDFAKSQESSLAAMNIWIDKHRNTPLNELTPLEKARKANMEALRESYERRKQNQRSRHKRVDKLQKVKK